MTLVDHARRELELSGELAESPDGDDLRLGDRDCGRSAGAGVLDLVALAGRGASRWLFED